MTGPQLLIHPRPTSPTSRATPPPTSSSAPSRAPGLRYSGTYREHAIGNCLIINNEAIPTPRHPSTCRPPAPDGDGSRSASPSAAMPDVTFHFESNCWSKAQPGMGSDTAVQRTSWAYPRQWDRKEAAQGIVPAQARKYLETSSQGDASNWAGTWKRSDQHLRWSLRFRGPGWT